MCEIETVLVSVCLVLFVTASFCTYWVYPEKKLEQHSEIEKQNPCENEHEDYCLNGECYYLLEEDTVCCNYIWLYEKKNVLNKICG